MTVLAIAPIVWRDIDQILKYLEREAGKREAGKTVARWYGLKFDAGMEAIRANPGAWPRRPRFGRLTRVYIVHPYLVFYDHFPDQKRAHGPHCCGSVFLHV